MITEEALALGELLKKRRKEMNISLKEAETATSIRTIHLQSIEDGEIAKLISPVYAQGFVKQYATFLGMDGERIIREYSELFLKPQMQEFSYGIGTLEMRGNHSASVKWFPNLIWVGSITLILVSAWYFAKFLGVI